MYAIIKSIVLVDKTRFPFVSVKLAIIIIQFGFHPGQPGDNFFFKIGHYCPFTFLNYSLIKGKFYDRRVTVFDHLVFVFQYPLQ